MGYKESYRIATSEGFILPGHLRESVSVKGLSNTVKISNGGIYMEEDSLVLQLHSGNKLYFSHGDEIMVQRDCVNELVRVTQLTVGDLVPVYRREGKFGNETVSNAYSMGIIMGCGCAKLDSVKKPCYIVPYTPERLEALKKDYPNAQERTYANALQIIIYEVDYFYASLKYNKDLVKVHETLYHMDRESSLQFLKGFYDSNVIEGKAGLYLRIPSKEVANFVVGLFRNFGIIVKERVLGKNINLEFLEEDILRGLFGKGQNRQTEGFYLDKVKECYFKPALMVKILSDHPIMVRGVVAKFS